MKKLNFILFNAIIVLFLLSACQSVDYSASEQVLKKDVADISFKLSKLSEEDLITIYGKDANPFIKYPGKFPRKSFYVFNTTITTQESVINLSRLNISLQIGSDVHKGSNQYNLVQNWNPYYINDLQELHMKNIIKKEMKPNEITITPDSPFKGLLVFLVPHSEEKEAIIRIPAKTPEGDEGVIEIPFTLKKMIDGKEEVPSENTGIFSE